MNVLVCGGRDFTGAASLYSVLDALLKEHGHVRVIEGGAKGADRLANQWATNNCDSDEVELDQYPADWEKWGKAAGAIRNQQMLDEGKPGLVLAFSGGKGTADMVRRARKAGVEVVEIA